MLEKVHISTGHFSVILHIVFSIILFLRSKEKKALKYLAITMCVCAMGYSLLVLSSYGLCDKPRWGFNSLFLISGAFFAFFFSLYPIEVSAPKGLSRKNILLLATPVILMIIANQISINHTASWREINSPSEVFTYIGEFNVWIRMIFYIISLAYFPTVLVICYRLRRRNISNWITRYKAAILILTLFYAIGAFYGNLFLEITHKLYFVVFNAILTYHAVFYASKENIVSIDNSIAQETENKIDENPTLTERLLRAMEEQKPWLNPELSQPMLASTLYTNRTTLSYTIHNLGYSNFQEFINYYRIEEFKRIAQREGISNIQDTFYRVGFRSKSTAFRCFNQFEKMTPSVYLQNNNNNIQ